MPGCGHIQYVSKDSNLKTILYIFHTLVLLNAKCNSLNVCVYECCDCASACVLVLNVKVRYDVCSVVSFEP